MVLENIPSPPQNILSGELFAYLSRVMDIIMNAALNGNPEAMGIVVVAAVGLTIGFVALYKASKVLFGLVKRLFLFFLLLSFVLTFFFNFSDKIFVPQPDPVFLVVGTLGILFAVIALIISILAFGKKAKAAQRLRQEQIEEVKEKLKQQVSEEGTGQEGNTQEEEQGSQKIEMHEIRPTVASQLKYVTQQALIPKSQPSSGEFSTQSLFSSVEDRSILTVFTYIIVAEFGVFSSVTVAAPNILAGLALFAAFILGAFVFIRKTYHSYLIGISHLFLGTVFAISLSLILGHIWVQHPISVLLSIDYFTTNALVATVTGVAVSLFMGSKE